jgi:hypothetical protein
MNDAVFLTSRGAGNGSDVEIHDIPLLPERVTKYPIKHLQSGALLL